MDRADPAGHAAPAIVDRQGPIAFLTLNRPQVLNALNAAMVHHLQALLLELQSDESVRAIVLRGAGDGFMAGGDIDHLASTLSPDDPEGRDGALRDTLDRVHATIMAMRRMNKPILAVVHGPCAGFGISLILACDLVIAADTARFTLAYSRLGITPDGGATWHLPRVVGTRRAMELMLLSDQFDAETAREMGLITRIAPEDSLRRSAEQLAERLAQGPTRALAETKALINAAAGTTLDTQLEREAEAFITSAATGDFREGVAAFKEKRDPQFRGR